jgi:hypothetical protein
MISTPIYTSGWAAIEDGRSVNGYVTVYNNLTGGFIKLPFDDLRRVVDATRTESGRAPLENPLQESK